MMSLKLKEQLRSLLKANDMTAAQLSRKAGVSKQVLSNWLSGEHPRKIEDVRKVAQVFSLSLDELLFAESPPEKKSNPNLLDMLSGGVIKGLYEVSIKKVK